MTTLRLIKLKELHCSRCCASCANVNHRSVTNLTNTKVPPARRMYAHTKNYLHKCRSGTGVFSNALFSQEFYTVTGYSFLWIATF